MDAVSCGWLVLERNINLATQTVVESRAFDVKLGLYRALCAESLVSVIVVKVVTEELQFAMELLICR